MVRRPALAALGASLLLVGGAAACGSSGGPTGPAAAAPVRMGAVKVNPPAGPIGTVFTLTADGLKEGEAVAFEITFPGEGKAYPGAAISVPADGTATTTYRATTANQPGDYVVRLTGPPGSLAEGRFTVTNGPPLSSTLPPDSSASSVSSTSLRTGTTRRSSRPTTTVLGATTTTLGGTKGSSTTATTRRFTTSLLTTTSKHP